MAFNWTCTFCGNPQTVTEANFSTDSIFFTCKESVDGKLGLQGSAIICANPDCQKASIDVRVSETKFVAGKGRVFSSSGKVLFNQVILPESSAKVLPEFIPAPIREDYLEACRIRDLSPKASATLSRRCLQGMIRDFCNIQKGRLIDEINALEKLVSENKGPSGVSMESIEAIDHVRGIGNIGAHMEKDINHIVPVDPEEAQILIGLIESLVDEWYVERETRKNRLTRLKELAAEKQTVRRPKREN